MKNDSNSLKCTRCLIQEAGSRSGGIILAEENDGLETTTTEQRLLQHEWYGNVVAAARVAFVPYTRQNSSVRSQGTRASPSPNHEELIRRPNWTVPARTSAAAAAARHRHPRCRSVRAWRRGTARQFGQSRLFSGGYALRGSPDRSGRVRRL